MKRIAFNLQKGGTGKTTLAVQTAENLSRYGKTVLIDFDPQGNATEHFCGKEFEHELADYFADETLTVHDLLVSNPDFGELQIIPTAATIGNLEDIKGILNKNILEPLFEELQKVGFKYCVLDTPPEMGSYVNTILSLCDEVVTPILPQKFSISGIKIFMAKTLAKARKENSELVFNKIIINNLNKSKSKDKFYLDTIPEIFDTFKVYKVSTSTKFESSKDNHKPLYKADEKIPGIDSIRSELNKLAEDLK